MRKKQVEPVCGFKKPIKTNLKGLAGEMVQQLQALVEDFFVQGLGFFLTYSGTQPSLIPILIDSMPYSDFHTHQVHMWCATYM